MTYQLGEVVRMRSAVLAYATIEGLMPDSRLIVQPRTNDGLRLGWLVVVHPRDLLPLSDTD